MLKEDGFHCKFKCISTNHNVLSCCKRFNTGGSKILDYIYFKASRAAVVRCNQSCFLLFCKLSLLGQAILEKSIMSLLYTYYTTRNYLICVLSVGKTFCSCIRVFKRCHEPKMDKYMASTCNRLFHKRTFWRFKVPPVWGRCCSTFSKPLKCWSQPKGWKDYSVINMNKIHVYSMFKQDNKECALTGNMRLF